MKPVYRRRPRVDPSKLAVHQLTGDENVTVVNRNTGKRITGAKAPTLRNLQDWLIRNPGFDVDAKWAHIVHKAVSICSSHYVVVVNILVIAVLSVHLSHGWISQKRCKLESPNLHRWLPGRL